MARTVSVGELQDMPRAESDTNGKGPGFQAPAVTVADQLKALVLEEDTAGMPLGQVVGLVRLAVAEKHINATETEIRDEAEWRWRAGREAETGPGSALFAEQTADEESGYDGTPFESTSADHLAGLDVEAQCTAEMSLHMITQRVREAVRLRGIQDDVAEAEIVSVAEAIWEGFSDNRKGPRVATVGPDGIVEGVRPAEMTPDRGPDVGTTVHTVSDETRFSGAGASDRPEPSKLVPTDQQFGGKLYRDAPELANLAEQLIQQHGFLAELINAEIRFYWRRKTGVSKGRVKIGYCKRASDLLGHFSGADFLIWLSATTARDGKFTDRQIEAALFHQLLHIETDDEGNFISARHDFEGFAQEIRHYGTWTEDLKLVVPAFTAAQQMGLFDVDDGIEDDEDDDERESGGPMPGPMRDGAGTLIHADGTALTDDEIEAMERHEQDDDEDLDDGDDDDVEAFDPQEDGDDEEPDRQAGDEGFATQLDPDDKGDILADPAVI